VGVNGPLAAALDVSQGEETVYLGNVLPSLFVIIKQIEGQKLQHCGLLQTTLIEALKKRFEPQLDFENKSCEEFVLASLSHPRFKLDWVPHEHVDQFRNLF